MLTDFGYGGAEFSRHTIDVILVFFVPYQHTPDSQTTVRSKGNASTWLKGGSSREIHTTSWIHTSLPWPLMLSPRIWTRCSSRLNTALRFHTIHATQPNTMPKESSSMLREPLHLPPKEPDHVSLLSSPQPVKAAKA